MSRDFWGSGGVRWNRCTWAWLVTAVAGPKGSFLHLQADGSTDHQLVLSEQGPAQGAGRAAVQQIQRILQPREMERGLCGGQGMSPVGSDLREGMATRWGPCLLPLTSLRPSLPSKMEMPGVPLIEFSALRTDARDARGAPEPPWRRLRTLDGCGNALAGGARCVLM